MKNKTLFNVTATFRVQFYLSLDGLKNGGDRLLTGHRTVAGLAAKVSSPATTSATIPASTPPGDYFLLVCADDTSQVIERNEATIARLDGEAEGDSLGLRRAARKPAGCHSSGCVTVLTWLGEPEVAGARPRDGDCWGSRT